MTVPVYWFWDGSVDDENDTLFMRQTLSANVSISAMVHAPVFLHNTLLAQSYTLDTNVNFGVGSSSANGIGLMMREGTQNDEYPIVYYRGVVTNNNVIFADFCWLIVRTTETGGIKLVYNGKVNEDGSCDNYSVVVSTDRDAYIDYYKFNTNNYSPVSVGYMYNDTNLFFDIDELILDGTGYIAHLSDNSIIENGLDSETGRHTQNKTDSIVKGVVDNWYKATIKGTPEESLLEDTVWCNDRSVISETYSIENMANGTNTSFEFAAQTRLFENTTKIPSLECTRDMDKFTVDGVNGNGDLDYPIGLLTVDEMILAGLSPSVSGRANTYLKASDTEWSLSPSAFDGGRPYVFQAGYDGFISPKNVGSDDKGIRPAISLNNSATIYDGNGSF